MHFKLVIVAIILAINVVNGDDTTTTPTTTTTSTTTPTTTPSASTNSPMQVLQQIFAANPLWKPFEGFVKPVQSQLSGMLGINRNRRSIRPELNPNEDEAEKKFNRIARDIPNIDTIVHPPRVNVYPPQGFPQLPKLPIPAKNSQNKQ